MEKILHPRMMKRDYITDSADMDLGAKSECEWIITDHLEITFTLQGSAMSFSSVLPFDDPGLPTMLREIADEIERNRKDELGDEF